MPTLQIKITEAQSRRLYLNALSKEVSQSELVRSLIDGLTDLQLMPVSQDKPSPAAAKTEPAETVQAIGFHRAPNPEFQAQVKAELAKLRTQEGIRS
jgi:hypothetical protein